MCFKDTCHLLAPPLRPWQTTNHYQLARCENSLDLVYTTGKGDMEHQLLETKQARAKDQGIHIHSNGRAALRLLRLRPPSPAQVPTLWRSGDLVAPACSPVVAGCRVPVALWLQPGGRLQCVRAAAVLRPRAVAGWDVWRWGLRFAYFAL